jgi:hypothetical protein
MVNALNIYLVDLRENRKLRSNERVRTIENGVVSEEPAPARIDCHYLLSAWSPAAPGPAIEPILDEHTLLYQAAEVLFRYPPFNPSRVYPAGSAALNAWPIPFRDVDLPAVVLPVEGFNKMAEFWGGMGQGALVKPALYLIVTLPVALLTDIAGPLVTTRITEYRISGRPETAEVWIHIGGHVLSPARPMAVGSATVQNIAAGGSLVTVDTAAPFREGDIVVSNNATRAAITQIVGNDLTLSNTLAGLGVGSTLRIANLIPAQRTFRMSDITGLVPGGTVLISGDDASNPGTTVTERAVIEVAAATGFVTLGATPVRTRTFNLNVAPANAPTLTGFAVGAWVALEDATGTPLQETTTDIVGRFQFAGLREGAYTLRVRAQGFAEATRIVEVPSATGNYDVPLV